MHEDLRCPACSNISHVEAEAIQCPEGHQYTAVGLAVATNHNTVKALWLAIRALEDDAAGLDYLVTQYPEVRAAARRREAEEAREAAQSLRAHASAAQRRLHALGEDIKGRAPAAP